MSADPSCSACGGSGEVTKKCLCTGSSGPVRRWRDERDGPGGFGRCFADCDGCRAAARQSLVRCDGCQEIIADDEALFSVVSPGEHQVMCATCATLIPVDPGREHIDVALVRDGLTRVGTMCDCSVDNRIEHHAADCAAVWNAHTFTGHTRVLD